MLHLLTATHTEAKSLIDNFKLKKKDFHEFPVYWNKKKNISLTISGIGKVLAATAVSYTASIFNFNKNNVWLNIGICGHKNYKIGDIFLVNKVIDKSSSKVWFPSININTKLEQASCTTIDKDNNIYEETLIDMELSGFIESSIKFTSLEFIHSLKVISDNEGSKNIFENKKNVTYLIKNKFLEIEKFIINILILNDNVKKNDNLNFEILDLFREKGFKENDIKKCQYFLKRMQLYNREISKDKILKLIHDQINLLNFLDFKKKI